jgi:hypothetical protein
VVWIQAALDQAGIRRVLASVLPDELMRSLVGEIRMAAWHVGATLAKAAMDMMNVPAPPLKVVLHKLGIGQHEAVLGGERLMRPGHGDISRDDWSGSRVTAISRPCGRHGHVHFQPFATVPEVGRSSA